MILRVFVRHKIDIEGGLSYLHTCTVCGLIYSVDIVSLTPKIDNGVQVSLPVNYEAGQPEAIVLSDTTAERLAMFASQRAR